MKFVEINDPTECEINIGRETVTPGSGEGRLCKQCGHSTWAKTVGCIWCGYDRWVTPLRVTLAAAVIGAAALAIRAITLG